MRKQGRTQEKRRDKQMEKKCEWKANEIRKWRTWARQKYNNDVDDDYNGNTSHQ